MKIFVCCFGNVFLLYIIMSVIMIIRLDISNHTSQSHIPTVNDSRPDILSQSPKILLYTYTHICQPYLKTFDCECLLHLTIYRNVTLFDIIRDLPHTNLFMYVLI